MSIINLIAIDGPAASGKSTLAELIAKKLNYFFFDTGVMYRAVTLAALDNVTDLDNESLVTEVANRIQIDVQPASKQDGRVMDILVDGKDITWQIRTPEVDHNVSKVSAYAGVRKAMTDQQRRIGERGNMVMVGRDIGTVVFPDAKHKIYLEASPEERARRRYVEVQKRGESISYEDILTSIRKRDDLDSSRAVAPLKPADDAYVIDSDGKTIDVVLQEALQILGKPVS
ncbi:MAG: cytidylate kinase [Chloroflexi bacterium HGW-Chloroflexi-4]|jgi:cytidylate kinase|nr:MAG: cytidylate kinase [Chloroflexi bacterium HGW-Chloroflexi-7]PKN97772.1 MAG: cytidylate kinase [Chloroflexi bacterium HGW-Chloroflexi-4]